ncbi:ATP-binding protein [Streptomyces pactum]|uniref:ATP-binding protein n=1 Tax=Streptomyces pactum TaxID=68249 RepID=A0ABS0NNQ3_9ACTN|nr:ATP-binding protein [Streptomyces pactum]MBH5336836.1 ATP-binding protein [Streptomyces pactum]
MSLPLTRRIARAALLVAAGAAPVVGAAGAAGAAELPKVANLSGVSTPDLADVGSSAESTTKKLGKTAGRVSDKGLPAAGKSLTKATRSVTGAYLPGAQAKGKGVKPGKAKVAPGLPGTKDLPVSTVISTDKLPVRTLPAVGR